MALPCCLNHRKILCIPFSLLVVGFLEHVPEGCGVHTLEVRFKAEKMNVNCAKLLNCGGAFLPPFGMSFGGFWIFLLTRYKDRDWLQIGNWI